MLLNESIPLILGLKWEWIFCQIEWKFVSRKQDENFDCFSPPWWGKADWGRNRKDILGLQRSG